MVTFVTLFLGLIMGERPVEVQPTSDVVRVELYLDGELAANLDSAPWIGNVDFGTTLLPHRLEAVAYDATGKETDRETQWINLVRSPAEASLSLELDPEGRETVVAVSWETVQGDAPRTSRVELDGVPITIDEVSRFVLPRYDPNQLHFLRVELDFADEVVAVAEATFGGFYTDTVSTELTSVVIDIGSDRKLELSDLSGYFSVRGEPLEPVAVEKGDGEVIIVRDALATSKLFKIYSRARQQGVPKLPKNTYARYYWTRPRESVVGDRRYLLHPHSGDQELRRSSLFANFLVSAVEPPNQSGSQLIAGASAVAGMASVSRNRRRTVLVILDEPGRDQTFFKPSAIRDYLGVLDVPMKVWAIDGKTWEKQGDHGWGTVTEVAAGFKLYRAVEELLKGLERQRVVWFSGRHLPQDIEVASEAPFVRVGAGQSSAREARERRRQKSRG